MLSYKRVESGKSYDTLYDQLDRINDHIQKVKIDLYNQETFNKLIISQVAIGIIVVDQNGTIKVLNDAALRLLNLQVFTHIKQLKKIQENLDEVILRIGPESQKVITVIIDDKIRQMLFRLNLYKLENEFLKLISFQDIKQELDIKEMESWQKLIRILTHEITNSIGPINSTIDTISSLFVDEEGQKTKAADKIEVKTINDAVRGIGIIKDRSIGLLDFVQKFRDLTLIPKPDLTEVILNEIFTGIKFIFHEELHRKRIDVTIHTDPKNLKIIADRAMIEQVIINLFKNSIEAGGMRIDIKARQEFGGSVIIQFSDNGKGIEKELQSKILVEFFSSIKGGGGTGLGMAITKTVIERDFHGSIRLKESIPNIKTTFSINLKRFDENGNTNDKP